MLLYLDFKLKVPGATDLIFFNGTWLKIFSLIKTKGKIAILNHGHVRLQFIQLNETFSVMHFIPRRCFHTIH